MPVVCIQRPNRKKKRHFTPQAIARTSTYAVAAGESKVQVLAAVIVALEMQDTVCILDCCTNESKDTGEGDTQDRERTSEKVKKAIRVAIGAIRHPWIKGVLVVALELIEGLYKPGKPTEPIRATDCQRRISDHQQLCRVVYTR